MKLFSTPYLLSGKKRIKGVLLWLSLVLIPFNALADNDIAHILNSTSYHAECDVASPASDTGGSSSSQSTIVLDPGHTPNTVREVDPSSGLITQDGEGATGERQNMWDTAQIIKSKLEQDGYKVILTKNDVDDNAGFVTKVQRADAANAALAVSLHYTGGVPFTQTSDHFGVTPQEVGRFRENVSDGKRKTFDDSALAQKSQQYAQIIAAERNKAGAPANVAPLDQSFTRSRGLPTWGDQSLVQLLTKTPWVYNEAGASGFDKQKYAEGIANGIEKAVPVSGVASTSSSGDCCGSGGGGGGTAATLTGSDIETKVWNYFAQKGLSPAAIAGIIGNLKQESGLNPSDSGGYLAQWSDPSRAGQLSQLASQEGKPVTDLGVQLDFMWQELNGGYKSVLSGLQKTTSVEDATNIFVGPNDINGNPVAPTTEVQRSGGYENPGQPRMDKRLRYAREALGKLGGGAASGSSIGGGCSSGSPDCTSATGNTKILCEAKQYAGIYYLWGGGHQGYDAFIKGCPDPSNPANNQPHGAAPDPTDNNQSGNPSACGLDCSGLVSIAVGTAFGNKEGWNVASLQSDTTNWQKIDPNTVQPGDVVTIGDHHVAIVDHYDASSGTVGVFQAHQTGEVVGPATNPLSDYSGGAFRYIGKVQ